MSDLVIKNSGNLIESFDHLMKFAEAVANSKLFAMKTKEEAFVLMMVAQAEGYSPVLAVRDYDVIQGKPALKAEAKLARFQKAGGRVEWHHSDPEKASATFYHPNGKSWTATYTIEDAKRAQLVFKDNWKKYPSNMLRARVVSDGIRMIFPESGGLMYTPEEVVCFEDEPKQVVEIETSKPNSVTNSETLKAVMHAMKEQYDEVSREILNEVYAKLMKEGLSDEDIPMKVREEFDSAFKRKN